jgi:CTP:molybdopterin cytidylyltransferase MocA
MGEMKQLLPFGGRTVLEHCVATLCAGGTAPIVVVLGYAAQRVLDAAGGAFAAAGVHPIINERHAEGMLTSVQAGLRAAASLGADGVVLGLADQPLVSAEVVRAVADALRASERSIVVPTYGGRRGHPIGLSMGWREHILDLGGPNVGLRDFIRAHARDTLLLPVDTEAILHDMDYPDDYRRCLSRLAGSPEAHAATEHGR